MTHPTIEEWEEHLNRAFDEWWRENGMFMEEEERAFARKAFMAGAETVFKQRLRKALWPDEDKST